MSTHLNAVVDSIALQVAQLERNLELAVDHHATCARESSTLASRMDDTRTQIKAHRATAVMRELSDKEAASLNLAMMDLADLERMLADSATATSDAATTVGQARSVLASSRGELSQLAARLRCDGLLEEVRKREVALCESLMELWTATRQVTPHARFINAWTPGEGLRRAAVHHQPPASGSFS